MPDDFSNDNTPAAVQSGQVTQDPHGQAAVLLIESLLHALVAHKVITLQTAVDVVDLAAEVRYVIAEDLEDTPATLARSLAIIDRIGLTLRIDLKTT